MNMILVYQKLKLICKMNKCIKIKNNLLILYLYYSTLLYTLI